MSAFIFKRLITFALTLMAATAVVFACLELLPGNAAQVILGDTATPEAIASLEKKLGLDKSAAVRYVGWVSQLAMGQTALSTSYDTSTASLIAERMQVSFPLAIMAMVLTVIIAVSAGLYAAAQHNKIADFSIMTASQLGLSIPNFWLAILLILLFSVHLQWVSAGGFPGWSVDDGGGLWEGIKALLLPAISLAAVQAAILSRVTRSAVLEVLKEDFVRTARAKGLSQQAVLWKHVLRNAMIPVLTVMGLQFGNLITGAIIVENVFVLPGIGRLIFQAIANRDLIVVRDVVMLLAATVICINLLVDLLYAIIDPRLKIADV
jgi:peptide/nickel transport system permease protein